MMHGEGLLSLETSKQRRCTTMDIFSEIDRLLRPEVTFLFLIFSFDIFLVFRVRLYLNADGIFGRDG